jgi:hypothetical protein
LANERSAIAPHENERLNENERTSSVLAGRSASCIGWIGSEFVIVSADQKCRAERCVKRLWLIRVAVPAGSEDKKMNEDDYSCFTLRRSAIDSS